MMWEECPKSSAEARADCVVCGSLVVTVICQSYKAPGLVSIVHKINLRESRLPQLLAVHRELAGRVCVSPLPEERT